MSCSDRLRVVERLIIQIIVLVGVYTWFIDIILTISVGTSALAITS
jgi:hypothetical protein